MLINISPKLWGPCFWKTMHFITFAYPVNPSDDDKQNVYNAIYALGNVLPCQKCLMHFQQLLQMYPLTNTILSSRRKLINWLYNIHNIVNKETHKEKFKKIELMTTYTSSSNKYYLIIIICLVIFLSFFIYFIN